MDGLDLSVTAEPRVQRWQKIAELGATVERYLRGMESRRQVQSSSWRVNSRQDLNKQLEWSRESNRASHITIYVKRFVNKYKVLWP